MSSDEYYRLFGLERNASSNDIKVIYRKLVKRFHPDSLEQGASPEEKKSAEEYFKRIQEAYEAIYSDALERENNLGNREGRSREKENRERENRERENRERENRERENRERENRDRSPYQDEIEKFRERIVLPLIIIFTLVAILSKELNVIMALICAIFTSFYETQEERYQKKYFEAIGKFIFSSIILSSIFLFIYNLNIFIDKIIAGYYFTILISGIFAEKIYIYQIENNKNIIYSLQKVAALFLIIMVANSIFPGISNNFLKNSQPDQYNPVPLTTKNTPISIPQAQSNEGLVAEWHFDGDAKDSSGNGNDGTISGATFVDGVRGKALSFNGVSDYIAIPPVTRGLPSGTVVLWFKATAWNPCCNGLFLWSGTGGYPNSKGGDGIGLGSHTSSKPDGQLLFGIYEPKPNEWNWAASGVIPLPEQWYFVAGTWGPNGVKIYVNGANKGTNPYKGSAPEWTNWGILGASSWEKTFFNGAIDEVRIYGRALSAEEIKASYNPVPLTTRNTPMSTPQAQRSEGLVAEWHFEGDAKDSSGNRNDGANGATFVEGRFGKALDLNERNNYIAIPNSQSLNPTQITVETWVKFNRLSPIGHWDNQFLIAKGNDRTRGSYYLSQNHDQFHFYIGANGIDQVYSHTSSQNLETNRWYHVTGTYDGLNIIIYVNGVLQGKTSANVTIGNSESLYFGYQKLPQWEYYLDGSLDDVRIYNRALSAEEIKASYEGK
jgi:curved DNA-binding protein CbpA